METACTTSFVTRRHRRRTLLSILFGLDAAALMLASLAAEFLRFGNLSAKAGLDNVAGNLSYVELSIIISLVWLVSLATAGLYNIERISWGSGEFSRVFRALALGVIAIIMLTYAIKTPGLSRAWMLLSFAFAVLLVSLGRLGVRVGLRRARANHRFMRKTLLVGCNAEGCDMMGLLARRPESGFCIAGLLLSTEQDVEETLLFDGPVPVLGVARDVRDVVLEHGFDTVLVASSAFSHDVVAKIVNDLRGMDVTIQLSSGLFEVLTSRVMVREVAGVPLIMVRSVAFSASQRRTKRAFDLIVASLIVLLGMPIWALIMLGIKLDSVGPVFYRQRRVGQDGVPFHMYKFRSMCDGADAKLHELQDSNEATGPIFKMKADPRVTRIGKWMRTFSVDEFPQLINVLRGEMSLVGPRPPLPAETEHYSEYDWRRMEVPPGMTGLWQVSGRSSLTFDEMVRLDLFYIENWSVGFDLALLMRTIPAVLFARGAY